MKCGHKALDVDYAPDLVPACARATTLVFYHAIHIIAAHTSVIRVSIRQLRDGGSDGQRAISARR